MRGFKKLWVFAFALIFLSFSFLEASAVANDFTAAAQAGFRACSCSAVEGTITIKNTGDFVNSFFVKQAGDFDSTLAPDKFTLAPGEEISVYEYIRLPCDAHGKYSLRTEIKTDLNLNKQFVQEIEAVKCANINIRPITTLAQGCRCTQLDYRVEVTNPGPFSDRYSFSLDRLGTYYRIVPDSAEIFSGESRNVSFALLLPCSYGSQQFNFVARAEKSNFKSEIPAAAIINSSCYNLRYNATINASLNPPTFSFNKKLIFPLVVFFILILILLIVFSMIILIKRKETEKPEKKEEPYWWENVFAKKEEKRMESVYKDFFRKKENKLLKIIFLIIVAVVLLAFTANYFLPPFLGNFTYNAVNATNATTNVTFLPFAPITTTTFKPKVKTNETLAGSIGSALPYASYIVAGVVILLVLVIVIRLRKEEKKEQQYYREISGKRVKNKLFAVALILLVLAVLAFAALAVFYGKGIAIPGKNASKNETNVSAKLQIPAQTAMQSAIQNKTFQNKTPELQNRTMFQLPELFSKESKSAIKSYIPYIILGILILFVIILAIKLREAMAKSSE